MRSALAPRWWAWHLALAAVLVSFGWLGWWQVDSFEDASGGDSTPGPTAAAVDVARVTDPGGRLAPGDVGRRVRAEGTWDAAGQLVVPGRARGGETGGWVVTPLRTTEGVLPVVRGWHPGADRPPPAPVSGPVVVTGVLQQSEPESEATVAPGGLPAGQVAYVATVALLDRLPYDADTMYDGFLALRSQDPADRDPLATVVAADRASGPGEVGRWRNLAYGLQWWVFAGAAVVFWASVLRRGLRPAPQTLSAPPRTT